MTCLSGTAVSSRSDQDSSSLPAFIGKRGILVFLLLLVIPLSAGSLFAGSRIVRVGIYQNEPKIHLSEEGEPSGFMVELLEAVADEEDWSLDWVPGEWPRLMDSLTMGRIDILPDVAFSGERSQYLDFHPTPAAESWSQVYTASSIGSLADLHGKRIAVLEGSIQESTFRRLAKAMDCAVEIIPVDSYEEAFRLTRDGETEACVANHFFGDTFYRDYGLVKTPVIFDPVTLHYAVATGRNQDLLAAIENRLSAWRGDIDSPYYRLLGELYTPEKVPFIPAHLKWILYAALALLIVAGAAAFILKWQVRARTAGLAKANRDVRRFKTVFDEANFGAYICDLEGNFTYMNRAFEKMYGYSAGELTGRHIGVVLPGPEGAVLREFKKILEEQNGFQSTEAVHLKKDGSLFTTLTNGILIRDDEGSPLFAAGTAVDITPFKQAQMENEKLQNQLFQAEKLKSLGRLAGGVAHDFNNALQAILGYTEMSLHDCSAGSDLHKSLVEIRKAALHSAELTGQLLAFARKQDINPRPIDLNGTVENMLNMLRQLLGEHVKLRFIPEVHICRVLMDPVQVSQILVNLVVNARDAIEGSGTVTIQTSEVTVAEGDHELLEKGPGRYARILVSDTGKGMDSRTMNSIFDPFYTTKDVGRGTGLGLASVFGSVKQNGGFIEVSSTPGEGSEFRIYIPCCEDRHADNESDREPDPQSPADEDTVMVVDDDSSILGVASGMLQMLGYSVITAISPEEGLRTAEDHSAQISVLITDKGMPGMTGEDFAGHFRTIHPETAIIYMSGYSSDVIPSSGAAPKGSFLQKPFSMRSLSEAVRNALNSR